MPTCEIRLCQQLYEDIFCDLRRKHPHAEERVGFVFGRYSEISLDHRVIYLYRYEPVSDERYIPTDDYGALVDDVAILDVMQGIREHRGASEGAFHVHIHGHYGQPMFSRPDLTSLPSLIPSFSRMDTNGANGLLLFSLDHGIAFVWLPGENEPIFVDLITIIGAPLLIFRRGDSYGF